MKFENIELKIEGKKSESGRKRLNEDMKRLKNEIVELKMLTSSKCNKFRNIKQKLKACNEGMLQENNLLKNNNEMLSHSVETSCIEQNLTTATSLKKLKKRGKFKFFCF